MTGGKTRRGRVRKNRKGEKKMEERKGMHLGREGETENMGEKEEEDGERRRICRGEGRGGGVIVEWRVDGNWRGKTDIM